MIEDLWYKNAIVYCLDVEKYADANGDGVGDFPGLMRRLDYLAALGVTCVWLQPFHPSPNRDNGYDVAEYYGVHPKHGTLGDYVEFMQHAHQRGIRVLIDLVVNHTSVDHPWFRAARADPHSPYREWYVWSRERPFDHDRGMVFPGVQKTTWTWDEAAHAHYFHRFYAFQADLDTHEEAVREEIERIMGFWLQLGVSGFRLDAVPFLIGAKGTPEPEWKDYELLHRMRNFLQWRSRDAVILAEANVPPQESIEYFGRRGDCLHMMLNFPVNQALFYALATADLGPLRDALEATYERPRGAQWVNFLRSHDELDLGRLTAAQRERVFAAMGPDESMQLYHRGIRRRLAPMLGNDRRRLEHAFSLLFTLPGTPMLQYGDEIGMGDDLSLPEREAARTPMQWSGDANGGFTSSPHPVRPVVDDPVYGYRSVNVEAQRRDPGSLLNWMAHAIRIRRECPEISWGDWTILSSGAPAVLAMRFDYRGHTLLVLHNFADAPCEARVDAEAAGHARFVNLFREGDSCARDGSHRVALEPYGYRWYRAGTLDREVARQD